MLAALAITLVPAPPTRAAPVERTFRVEASQFSFTPGTLSVNPGDWVTIELVAVDVVHGIYLDDYDLSVSADPGQTATLTFVADRPGTFRFRCLVACGDLHPFMIGKLHVGPNWLMIRALGLAALAIVAVVVGSRSSGAAG